jgi:hypothetical protein
MVERKQQFYGDTLNLFTQEDQNYHWLRFHWYYATFPKRDRKKIWTSRITLVGCVQEYFDYKVIVTCCVDKFV